jgi:hypothetical protein
MLMDFQNQIITNETITIHHFEHENLNLRIKTLEDI